jgi:hypothetical protein
VRVGTLGLVASFLLAGHVYAEQGKPAATQETRPPLASVEARWGDVYCDLMELSRTSPTELSVRFQFRNQRKEAFRLPNTELVPLTRVFDAPAARCTAY